MNTTLKDFGKSVLEDKIMEELAFFTASIKEKGSENTTDRFRSTLDIAVANVIGSIVWGYRSDYDDPAIKKHLEMKKQMLSLVGSSGAIVAFPFLK